MYGSMEEGTSSAGDCCLTLGKACVLVRRFLVQPFLVLPVLTLVVKESLNQAGLQSCVQPPVWFLAIRSLMRAWRPPDDFLN